MTPTKRESSMIVRCQLCNTPLFELTIREKEVIIIVKSKHHGEWHKSLIRIEDMIAEMREKPEKRTLRHNLIGHEVVAEVSEVVIVSDDEVRVVMIDGSVITASGCSPRMMSEMQKAWPDAEDLREESPDGPIGLHSHQEWRLCHERPLLLACSRRSSWR